MRRRHPEKEKAALLEGLGEEDFAAAGFLDVISSAVPSVSLPSAPSLASIAARVAPGGGMPSLASVASAATQMAQKTIGQGIRPAQSIAAIATQQAQKLQQQVQQQAIQKIQAAAKQAGVQIPTPRQILNVQRGALARAGVSQPMSSATTSAVQIAKTPAAQAVADKAYAKAKGVYHSGLESLMHKPGAAPAFKKGIFRVGGPLLFMPSAQGEGDTMTTLQVQKALNALKVPGTPLTEDGASGPMTKQAIKNFQSSKGLTADGVVGPMTTKALQGAATSKGFNWSALNPFTAAKSAAVKAEHLAERFVPGVKPAADAARGVVSTARGAVQTAKGAVSTVRDVASQLPSAQEAKGFIQEAREGVQEGKEALGVLHTVKKVAPWAAGGAAVVGLAAWLYFKKG